MGAAGGGADEDAGTETWTEVPGKELDGTDPGVNFSSSMRHRRDRTDISIVERHTNQRRSETVIWRRDAVCGADGSRGSECQGRTMCWHTCSGGRIP
jgi:hypothetical protein